MLTPLDEECQPSISWSQKLIEQVLEVSVVQTVRNKLRVLRAERRWSQTELGRRFAEPRDPATISRWENGQTIPSVVDAFEVAYIFGMPITDIFMPENQTD